MNETSPEIAADGLTLFFSSDRGGNVDIYVATRASRIDSWSTPTRVAELSSTDEDLDPFPSGELLHIFMDRKGAPQRLFHATRASATAPWSTPVEITELTSGFIDSSPTLDLTLTTIIWSSTRSGDADLWMASRAAVGAPFANLQQISELSTPNEETDPWLASDGRTLYFVCCARSGTDQSLYAATR